MCGTLAAVWLRELVGGPCALVMAVSMLEDVPLWIYSATAEDVWPHFVASVTTNVLKLSSGELYYRQDDCSEYFPIMTGYNDWHADAGKGLSNGVNTAPPRSYDRKSLWYLTSDASDVEGNTATSCVDDCIDLSCDYSSFAQRTVAMSPERYFDDAAERGLPFTKVFRITRRHLTSVWYDQGIGLAFEHFRLSERGVWEKKFSLPRADIWRTILGPIAKIWTFLCLLKMPV